jgi:hypothetical protein
VSVPPVPRGLDSAGRSLWRRILADFGLREDEKTVLEAACRTADTIARLDAALVDAPLTVPGSAGQLREHPLLSEVRQQRALLGRLLHQLKLPEPEALGWYRDQQRTTQARTAARSRWGVSGGARLGKTGSV